jgi:hypothetical protein
MRHLLPLEGDWDRHVSTVLVNMFGRFARVPGQDERIVNTQDAITSAATSKIEKVSIVRHTPKQ